MASRKMTFTFPEEIATSFTRRVGPSGRSKFVVEAVAAKMREREAAFEAACDALEGNEALVSLALDMDSLNDDPMEESVRVSKAG
jgi:hypothetical protein